MEHAYKFRILPTAAQVQQIGDTLAACTYLYNRFLSMQLQHLDGGGSPLDYVDCAARFQEMRNGETWMARYDQTALRDAVASSVRDVQWYAGLPGSPQPRPRRHDDLRLSYRVSAGSAITIGDGTVRLPLLGEVASTVVRTEPLRVTWAAVIQRLGICYELAIRCETEEAHPSPLSFSVGYFEPSEFRKMLRRRAPGGGEEC